MNDEKLLRQRRIPPGLHYISAEQSDLWRTLATAHSPAGEQSVLAAYSELFAWFAEESAGNALQLITLGAGSGEKERQLVRLLNAKGCSLQISAVDVSESLALETVAKLLEGERACDARSVVGDFLEFDRCSIDASDAPCLFTAFGLSPNTQPGEFFRGVSRLLRSGDRALLSANLWPEGGRLKAESEVLAQYDNPETRRWLGRLFREWGMPEDKCPSLEFSIGCIDGVAAVIATAQWPEVDGWQWDERVPEAVKAWRAGELIEAFYSLRYTTESFSEQATQAGLSVQRSASSSCGREAVFLVL